MLRPGAPRLSVEGEEVTLATEGSGHAWLGLAGGLGFQPRQGFEGVFLLEPEGLSGIGSLRPLLGGHATWRLDELPPGEPVYLQGFAFDPTLGRLCFTEVVRFEPRP